MAFFRKRALSPVERFESALREKQAARESLAERLKAADRAVVEEGETVCCYARSEKSWIRDPAGIPWEAYRTMEDAQLFSTHPDQTLLMLAEPTAAERAGDFSASGVAVRDPSTGLPFPGGPQVGLSAFPAWRAASA